MLTEARERQDGLSVSDFPWKEFLDVYILFLWKEENKCVS